MPRKPATEKPLCHIHDDVYYQFVEEIRQNVCVKDTDCTLKEHTDGKYYCLFHLPIKDKDIEKFKKIFKAKLEAIEDKITEVEKLPESKQTVAKENLRYDFRYVWFPSNVDLVNYKFSVGVDFSFATFSAAADFCSARFLAETLFKETKFSKNGTTRFCGVSFTRDTYFDGARFQNDITFFCANFEADSDILFRGTFFAKDVNFRFCTTEGYLRFKNLLQGEENKFDFEEAAFENASRISVQTVRLQPNWFVNVDARKFVFINIEWQNLESDYFKNKNIKAELKCLEKRDITKQNKHLLEIACRQLSVNAEENNRYEEAAKFRYMAMEIRRLENTGWRRFLNLYWFYKWSSGYGESWRRAVVVLLGILILFGILYAMPFAKFDFSDKGIVQTDGFVNRFCENNARIIGNYSGMNLCDGAVHSLFVATLQRPEPKAVDTLTRFFVILETILAPIQAALLALAIRRKFMR